MDACCGAGELVSAYRRMNPKVRLLGIERDPLAASRAAPHLDQVSTVDLETDPLPFDVPEGIDCIVYHDVLTELDDPWAVVRRHAKLLSPDGVMLMHLPNAEYWRFTERHLRGMTEEGEPDWDHHRHAQWLSIGGIQAKLRRAELALCSITPVEPDAEAAQEFCDMLAPSLSMLSIDPKAYARRASASHFICQARKELTRPMILSGSMLPAVGGVSHVRVVHPLQAVGSDPDVTTSVTDRISPDQTNGSAPRIFVLHRPSLMGNGGLDTLRALTNAGYLVVTEFDDHPEHFQMMRLGGDLTFSGVHAVQTSTVAMAEVLRRYNPEVAVFPNAVVSLPEISNFADPDQVTMFFGALNRERDWQPLMPIINAVAATAGERLRFEVVHDQAFFDALETEHKTFTATCDYETYLGILGRSEVSFMPLRDTPFNRAKSDLKFIEAGASRVAALASSVVYGDSIDDGCTGLLFRDTAEFHARLLRLVAMPDLARDLGDAARRHVTEHRMLAYQVAPRIAWYRSLWIRREALEAARQDRMERRLAD